MAVVIKRIATLDVRTRAAWRAWLRKHHRKTADMKRALKANARAWRNFEQLAPGYRRKYVGWVDSAKRAETKERRLREAVERLARGERLGLK